MIATDIRALGRGLIVTAVAAALVALCWMSAADRMVADSSQAGKVYFGGRAAAQLAFHELAEDSPRSALEYARWAVRTAPIDPSSTSALGSALLVLGQSDDAYAAFAVAGGLGWRNVPTQLYWLAQAVADGDAGVAAQRLDALLRLDVRNDAVAKSLNLIERTQSGQAAVAALLLKNPPWENRFLANMGYLTGDDFAGRVAAVDMAAGRGAAIDCDAIGVAANVLITQGRTLAARDLWRRACDRSGDLYLSDGGFEMDPAKLAASPFNWLLEPRAGLDADIMPSPPPLDGHALRIASSLTVRTAVARQLMALRPGRYALTWKTALDNGMRDDSIAVLIGCNSGAALESTDAKTAANDRNLVTKMFSVPAQNCPLQTIEIQKAASISGDRQTGWIDDVAIKSLARP